VGLAREQADSANEYSDNLNSIEPALHNAVVDVTGLVAGPVGAGLIDGEITYIETGNVKTSLVRGGTTAAVGLALGKAGGVIGRPLGRYLAGRLSSEAATAVAGAESRAAVSGTISQTGARTVAQALAREAKAERAYEAIRATDDIAAIAKNTGMSVQKIGRIKNHLFVAAHPRSGGMARFDADADIAEAWQRLHSGNYLPHDIDLLNHEYFESKFMGIFKTDYETGHAAAESRYPANLPPP